MKITYHRQFEKDLDRYGTPEKIREVFDFTDQFETESSLQNLTNIKKLSGFTDYYRVRFGDYRLGFRLIENNTLQLDRFLHRKDIYKKYP